jgi:hypothetical protein
MPIKPVALMPSPIMRFYFNGKTFSLLDPNGIVGTNFSFALSLNNIGDIVAAKT